MSRNPRLVLLSAAWGMAVSVLRLPAGCVHADGLLVESVAPNSPAAKAGIQVGDRLLECDGQRLRLPSDLLAVDQKAHAKKEFALRVQRGNDGLTLTVPSDPLFRGLGAQVRPDLPTAVLSLYDEGRAAQKGGDYGAAVLAWTAAARSAEELGEVLLALWLHHLVGEAYGWRWYSKNDRSDLGAQRAEVLKAWDLLNQLAASLRGGLKGDPGLSMQAMLIASRLAWNSFGLNDFSQARRWFETASRLAIAGGPSEVICLGDAGYAAYFYGDLASAQDLELRALGAQERLEPEAFPVALILDQLGRIAYDRGDLAAAEGYFTRAIVIKERVVPNTDSYADSLRFFGLLRYARGDLAAAEEYMKRALSIHQRGGWGSQEVTAQTLDDLGEVAQARGDLAPAEDYHRRALAMHEWRTPGSLDVARSLDNLGALCFRRGDGAAALNNYTRALAIRERVAPGSLHVAATCTHLGWLALRERRLTSALEHFLRAVEVLESQRRKIRSLEGRSFFLERYANAYAGLLRTYIELRNLPLAFETLERAHARSFLEMLAERSLDFSRDAPKELLRKQQELDWQRNGLRNQLVKLDPQKEAERIDRLRAELERTTVLQRELAERLRKASPKLAALQYPQPLGLPAVQRALDPGTLLLAYAVDEEECYLFAVSRTMLELHRLGIGAADLRDQVEAFRRAASSPGGRTAARGQQLFDLLVRPAQAAIAKAQRVLICADGPLHTLPFAALATGRSVESARERTGHKEARYFVEDKPLHMVASASVYAQLRGQRKGGTLGQPARLLLALADPACDRSSEAEKGLLAAFAVRGAELGPLPNTRREVEAIRSLYGKASRVREGAAATEAAVRAEGPKAELLHFACHGLLDDRDPLASALALTPRTGRGGRMTSMVQQGAASSRPTSLAPGPIAEDDGLLHAYEVMEKLRLNADLVVLSACQSGLGQETKNEGIVGMTRAFQYAGTKSIVVSLWNVADESTAALMTEFYRHLKAGKPKDEALRGAQLSFLHPNPKSQIRNRKSFSHPFYWAPFVLVGDWR